MVQIIPAAQKSPTTAQRLSAGVGQALNIGQQLMSQQQQRQAAESLGIPGHLSPELQKTYLQEQLKGQQKEQQLQNKFGMLGQIFGGQGRQQPRQPKFGEQFEPQEFSEGSVQQQLGFDPSELTAEDIAMATAIDPQFGGMLQKLNESALRDRRAQEELQFKKFKESPEHRRETQLESSQAQADVKYNQTLQEASKQHELKQQTLDRLEALNKKGVTGKPYEKLLEKWGLVNLTSEGRREFAADVKNLITDIRSILGGQFSAFEFQTILNAYPSADFSKEANAAIIKNLKDFQDIKKKEVEFAQQIKKDNKGKIPFDFQAIVNEKVREYAASKLPEIKKNAQKIMNEEYGIQPGFTLMFDPNGQPLNVPSSEIERYESLGAMLP